MEVSDRMLVGNHDWDPLYLKKLFTQDFYDFTDMWHTNIKIQI